MAVILFRCRLNYFNEFQGNLKPVLFINSFIFENRTRFSNAQNKIIQQTFKKMKKLSIILSLFLCAFLESNAQQFKVITSVESIVPSGMGRSRIIDAQEDKDFEDFTSEQTDEDNTRNKSKRSEIRVKNFEETKLLNFYNIAGIRFQNIAANDAVISSKLSALAAEGWELAFVTSAVEADAGQNDGQGIFITRYVFKKD
tara:strand:+ start:141745 stop:142341 length:597 start_codon:yes stop_codon:yes gene_type:complete